MRYTVLLHHYPTGIYEAFAPAVPACVGKGKTRSEALAQLRNILQDWLSETEITEIELTESECHNPWLATAGMFRDDPMLEPMLNEIYSLRDIDTETGFFGKTRFLHKQP